MDAMARTPIIGNFCLSAWRESAGLRVQDPVSHQLRSEITQWMRWSWKTEPVEEG